MDGRVGSGGWVGPSRPRPESGWSWAESARLQPILVDPPLIPPSPMGGWVFPPPSRVARGRPDSESADSAPSRPTLPSMGATTMSIKRSSFRRTEYHQYIRRGC
ncbi:hypothetical protein Taro_014850 [Colocasia esculenta]|uniref:Uncharacterized protein n=1 Tax=Colocasia esculenta TaxID=4460 RepID=A0A843URD8_COLES|nr:hypothetical protein [Colocasia esculenta]